MLIVHFAVVALALTAGCVTSIVYVLQAANRGSSKFVGMTMFANGFIAIEQVLQNLIFAKLCYNISTKPKLNLNTSVDSRSSISSYDKDAVYRELSQQFPETQQDNLIGSISNDNQLPMEINRGESVSNEFNNSPKDRPSQSVTFQLT